MRYISARSLMLAVVAGALGLSPWLRAQPPAINVLSQHYDRTRLGATLVETALNTTTVSPGKFGKLWTLYADGQVVAQPLYVSALRIDTTGNPNTPLVQGTFNAVIVATMHNTVYVYEADRERRGPDGRTIPLWATWLGQPRAGGKEIDMWSTNDPEWGILGTPVVSDDKSTLYVVAWHDDGPQGLRYKLHALDMQKGVHRVPPALIGVASNDPSNPCRPQSPFNPCTHKQRTGLLLAGGVVYAAFGGDGNRGALFGFDAQTLAQRVFWSPTPSGTNGGIWQSGQAPAADADGNIYLLIGNGTFDANKGGQNYGNSFVKLKLEGQNLVVKDWFTPCNFAFLNQLDLDLGSGGAVLLPGTPPRIVSGGKEGVLYVVNPANMGKFTPGATDPACSNANVVQEVKSFDVTMANGQAHYGNIHGSPVFWAGPDAARVYAWGENSTLKAYKYRNGRLQEVNAPRTSAYRPPHGMPGGMLALSANGNRAGTGIVWAVVPLDGDANQQRGVKGIVLALDAQDVSRTLWTSEQFVDRDRLGLFAKFNPPVVAAGKLFVATYGNDEPRRTYAPNAPRPAQFPPQYYVAVYGLLPPATPAPVVVNQNRDDVTVVRAATGPLGLSLNQCTAIDGVSVDCTDALTQSAGSPSLHRLVFAANQALDGCALLRVTTASKTSGLDNSNGIGFWSAQVADGNQTPENSGRFVPKDRLKAVGQSTLLSGAPATLHEFVGVTNCTANGVNVGRLFKPYMQFTGAADDRIFRNWDVAENYQISQATPAFDRSKDVLR
jgi:hypothetical protein